MNDQIDRLREELTLVDDDAVKTTLLNRMSEELHRADPKEAIRLAKRALVLAASEKDREAQAESHRNIGRSDLYLSNFGGAILHLRRAIRLFEKEGKEVGKAGALSNLGSVLYHLGDYRQALDALEEALEICQRHDNSETMNMVLSNLAIIYGTLGDYSKALDYNYRSIAIKEEIGVSIVPDLTNIGAIHFEMHNWEQALECFRRSLDLRHASGDRIGEITALFNIGAVYFQLEELDAYRDCWMQAIELARQIDEPYQLANGLYALAALYRQQGEFDTAWRYVEEASAIAERIGSKLLQLEILFEKASLHRSECQLPVAVALLDRALLMAADQGSKESQMTAHLWLAEIYEELGEASRALSHHKQYVAIREDILSLEKQRTITEIETRADIERALKEREILRLKSERLELEMQHKSKELTTLAMQLVQKNEFLESVGSQIRSVRHDPKNMQRALDTLLREIELSRNADGEWEIFEQQFRNIHQDFTDRLARKHSDLSPTELKVCALLKINLSTKEIANMLCCSPRTVEDHRYRIRTKLGLPKESNLSTYLAAM
jgi:tetratricopeptide (TPR) repeat protein